MLHQRVGHEVAGVRETGRIHGEYAMTEDDILEGRRYSDVVAVDANQLNPRQRGAIRRTASSDSGAPWGVEGRGGERCSVRRRQARGTVVRLVSRCVERCRREGE